MTTNWYDMIEGSSGLPLQDFYDENDAPETYAAFHVGLSTDPLIEEVQQQFPAIAKGLNLTQMQAQNLLTYFLDHLRRTEEQNQQELSMEQEGKLSRIKSDPDITQEGLDRVILQAQKALKTFGSPALPQALDETGLGLEPAFIKFASSIGRQVTPNRRGLRADT